MKPLTPQLRNLLATESFAKADLYTFTLVGGGTYRFTDADRDLTWGGNTYSAGGPAGGGPLMNRDDARAKLSWTTGTDVGSGELAILPGENDLLGDKTWYAAAITGQLDAAVVQIDRAFFPAWGEPITGVVALAKRRVADIAGGLSSLVLTLNDFRELLNITLPRHVYGAGCRHTLFNAGCGLAAASYQVEGAVTAVTSRTVFSTDLANAATYFALGRIVFTSGDNAGYFRSVSTFAQPNGQVSVIGALPYQPQVGDEFVAWPGCDKLVATCQAKFSNKANFGGQPYIPRAETAL